MHRELILLASTIVAFVYAQTGPTLPTCATSCITSLLPASCNGNPTCICKDSGFLDNIGCCVFKACDTADQTAALAYAHGVCDGAGASSLLPTSATCTSGQSGSASTSATGSAASNASSQASSVSSSLSSAASSASASMSSAASSASASASSAINSATASAASAASSATASPTNAANHMAVGFGAMGAGMLGLAALL